MGYQTDMAGVVSSRVAVASDPGGPCVTHPIVCPRGLSVLWRAWECLRESYASWSAIRYSPAKVEVDTDWVLKVRTVSRRGPGNGERALSPATGNVAQVGPNPGIQPACTSGPTSG